MTTRWENPTTTLDQLSFAQSRVGAPYGNPMGRTASEHGNRVDNREGGMPCEDRVP